MTTHSPWNIKPAHSHLLFSLGTAFLVALMVASTFLILMARSNGTRAQASASFIFTADGDYGQTSDTTAVFNHIATSGASFNLGLGDYNYNPPPSTADTWSTYAKGLLPPQFPFEIVPGDHDTNSMSTYATDLPNQIGDISATCPACAYAQEYSFDYPVSAPLARFIMISPGGVVPGYNYSLGGPDYNWVSQQIDGARAAGIPWVIVGMAIGCLYINSPSDSQSCLTPDLFNLLLSKKVDLILQAHLHYYAMSKQLALNSTTCTSLPTDSYDSGCVVDASTNLTKGAGTTIVTTGTGGESLVGVSSADPKTGYFETWMGSNVGLNPTFGVSQFSISATKLTAQYIAVSKGTYTNSFTITGSNPTPTPVPSPSASVTASPTTTPSPTPSPSSSPSPTGTPSPTVTGPVSKTWYFAEGKVGAGFTEYLTVENPDTVNDCTVTIQYLLGGNNPVSKSVNVVHASRFTESVNSDLNMPANSSNYQTDSAIVTVDPNASPDCSGVVAERPMYFTNFIGVSSGSDVLGATKTGTTFYFADVPTGGGYASFITVLNPGTTTANVTANFDVGGTTINTLTVQVAGGTRGTIIPNNSGSLQHAAVTVTSDQPVVVERPDYFSNVNGGNAQAVSGSSSVVGVQNLQNDWLFAEGYTGEGFQEYLVLANFGTSPVAANVKLEFSNGHTETVPETIAPLDQTFVDVNAAIASSLGTCDTTPCQPTQDVSAEVSGNGNFIAQREMFFHYTHVGNGRNLSAAGGSDVIGEGAPGVSAYSFAEGYTNTGYDEWLTLQNPTANNETITIMLVNEDGRSFSQGFSVVAHSRFTIDITGMVIQNLIQPNDTFMGYEVSMVVQSTSGVFVAERPMYWNTGSAGTQGGSDVIGYDGS